AVGGGGGAAGPPMASGRRADLWAGAEALSAPAAGTREAGVAVGNARGLAGGLAGAGLEWEAEHGVRRAGQSETPTDAGRAHPPDVVDYAGCAALAAPSGMVAGLLPFRAPPRVLARGTRTRG